MVGYKDKGFFLWDSVKMQIIDPPEKANIHQPQKHSEDVVQHDNKNKKQLKTPNLLKLGKKVTR